MPWLGDDFRDLAFLPLFGQQLEFLELFEVRWAGVNRGDLLAIQRIRNRALAPKPDPADKRRQNTGQQHHERHKHLTVGQGDFVVTLFLILHDLTLLTFLVRCLADSLLVLARNLAGGAVR